MSSTTNAWYDVELLARSIAQQFSSIVAAISAVPYQDSFDREGVQFLVTLRDRPADYQWKTELYPIEEALGAALRERRSELIPYTDYQLESDVGAPAEDDAAS